jgi:hypothetical protein
VRVRFRPMSHAPSQFGADCGQIVQQEEERFTKGRSPFGSAKRQGFSPGSLILPVPLALDMSNGAEKGAEEGERRDGVAGVDSEDRPGRSGAQPGRRRTGKGALADTALTVQGD